MIVTPDDCIYRVVETTRRESAMMNGLFVGLFVKEGVRSLERYARRLSPVLGQAFLGGQLVPFTLGHDLLAPHSLCPKASISGAVS
ncbi:MAG: hypothetical protein ABJM43_05175 [Paracoccaceae bacterium]